MRAQSLKITLLAAALLALGGCVAYPASPYYAEPSGSAIIAPYGPPPLVAETYGVAPYPGAIWIGGYWSWSSGRHVWTPGRWEAPRTGYHWVPRTWSQGPNGHWHQHGGHWERG